MTIDFFLSDLDAFYFFVLPNFSDSSTTFNKSGENELPCYVAGLTGKFLVLHP